MREALRKDVVGADAIWDKMYPVEPSMSELLLARGDAFADPAERFVLRKAQVSAWHLYLSDWEPDAEVKPDAEMEDLAAWLDDLGPQDLEPDGLCFDNSLPIAAETVVLMATSRKWEGALSLIRAICAHLHDCRALWPRDMCVRVGYAIDCWCQATGIDVDNPTGCWEIVIGPRAEGWPNRRTCRP